MASLIGKRIVKVREHSYADEGIELTLEDGTTLSIGYSADEDEIRINDVAFDGIDVEELCGDLQ